jgi:hypothetical protein
LPLSAKEIALSMEDKKRQPVSHLKDLSFFKPGLSGKEERKGNQKVRGLIVLSTHILHTVLPGDHSEESEGDCACE